MLPKENSKLHFLPISKESNANKQHHLGAPPPPHKEKKKKTTTTTLIP
jgi:hypothetical protein